jgi:hypothetical protein
MIVLQTVALLFMTPVTDVLVAQWSSAKSISDLSDSAIVLIRSIKFVLTMALFTSGVYERLLREEVTDNFRQRESAYVSSADQEKDS